MDASMWFLQNQQQNDDIETSSIIIQDVIDMLPSTTSLVNWKKEGENTEVSKEMETNESVFLNNLLLTKESEIAALKEVISRWKTRASEAESNAYIYYLDQLESIQTQHENELKSLEVRYTRKLDEKDDIILSLREQVDYLIVQNSRYLNQEESEEEEDYDDDDTKSYISLTDDNQSIASSFYDRDFEQGLSNNEPNDSLYSDNSNIAQDLKSETILNNIQNTMRAIELELSAHHQDNDSVHHHRRSPTLDSKSSCFTSSTLIDSETRSSASTKKTFIKKKPFSINRIFKTAFPKLCKKKKNIIYYNSETSSYHHRSSSRDSAQYSIEPWCQQNTVTTPFDPLKHNYLDDYANTTLIGNCGERKIQNISSDGIFKSTLV